ncbi:unnamed protein product [Adineta steineri]|uniref:UDP-N-acetylglucosamine transporter n=1 Tax=Adineta steineri TaxID=433720 RepID=A0A815FC32_9BILA|nr:unnamed protein product [Adineta steineri]CAF1584616.1 unnamed protein product [Adineta steineri]
MTKIYNRSWISLLVLVCQTTSLVLLLRCSRTVNSEKYLPATAIVTAEVLKGIVCIFLVWLENDRSINRVIRIINEEIYNKPYDTMKLAIPSGLYAIQNNLLFIALSYLNAATFQVTYQLKILTTALFCVFILKKRIEKHQWFSLFMLAIGVALVIWPTPVESNKRLTAQNQAAWLQQMMGFCTVLVSTVTSGFVGVYFEKIVNTDQTSIWVRNIQLGIFGTIFGLLIVFCFDYKAVMDKGFFQGYTTIVWIVIFLQATGGLIIGTVIKYADTNIRVFSNFLSILFLSVISYFVLHDLTPTLFFYIGTMCVLTAIFLYAWGKPIVTLWTTNQVRI